MARLSAIADKKQASDNGLRKLSRKDLLDMLLEQSLEIDRLEEDNHALKRELKALQAKVSHVASIEAREARVDALLRRMEAALMRSGRY